MSDQILPDKTKLINKLLQEIKSVSDEEVEKLITFFYVEKGISIIEIAKVLGVTRSAVHQRYPNLSKAKKHKLDAPEGVCPACGKPMTTICPVHGLFCLECNTMSCPKCDDAYLEETK